MAFPLEDAEVEVADFDVETLKVCKIQLGLPAFWSWTVKVPSSSLQSWAGAPLGSTHVGIDVEPREPWRWQYRQAWHAQRARFCSTLQQETHHASKDQFWHQNRLFKNAKLFCCLCMCNVVVRMLNQIRKACCRRRNYQLFVHIIYGLFL